MEHSYIWGWRQNIKLPIQKIFVSRFTRSSLSNIRSSLLIIFVCSKLVKRSSISLNSAGSINIELSRLGNKVNSMCVELRSIFKRQHGLRIIGLQIKCDRTRRHIFWFCAFQLRVLKEYLLDCAILEQVVLINCHVCVLYCTNSVYKVHTFLAESFRSNFDLLCIGPCNQGPQ